MLTAARRLDSPLRLSPLRFSSRRQRHLRRRASLHVPSGITRADFQPPESGRSGQRASPIAPLLAPSHRAGGRKTQLKAAALRGRRGSRVPQAATPKPVSLLPRLGTQPPAEPRTHPQYAPHPFLGDSVWQTATVASNSSRPFPPCYTPIERRSTATIPRSGSRIPTITPASTSLSSAFSLSFLFFFSSTTLSATNRHATAPRLDMARQAECSTRPSCTSNRTSLAHTSAGLPLRSYGEHGEWGVLGGIAQLYDICDASSAAPPETKRHKAAVSALVHSRGNCSDFCMKAKRARPMPRAVTREDM